jgi:hypothetical protein
VIFGLDFMRHTDMSVDVGSRTFGFGFAPGSKGEFFLGELDASEDGFLQHLQEKAMGSAGESKEECSDVRLKNLIHEFPALFSPTLGTAKCAPYEIELTDSTPVCSPPYIGVPRPNYQFFVKWLMTC